MNYVQITAESLDKEHICCAMGLEKDPQVASKKAWLRDRINEGLVFLKADIRGKCFIEYIPAEYAWVPIEADGYMHINCFWVSGSLQGQGHGSELLNRCIQDAKLKNKLGLTIITSTKKKPYLSDPKYLAKKGFRLADTAGPYFELLYLPFRDDAAMPKFKKSVKEPAIDTKGFALYYTNGCPFNAKYVPLVEECAKANNIPLTVIKINSLKEAQNAPAAWTNYALFYNGEYITNEILTEKKFLAINQSLAVK